MWTLLRALLLISIIHCVLAKTRRFEFTIQRSLLNPDCYSESYAVVTVNGQFPSPTIRVVKDDIVQVVVKNSGENNVTTSIHFHGILQMGTNHADGVAGITQIPIAPGAKFFHQFQIRHQVGSFLYHAHVGVEDDTVQGPFIVYESEEALLKAESEIVDNTLIRDGPYGYHGEHILQYTEWWHQSMYDRGDYYLSPNFAGDTGPDSLLLNGKSVYNDASVDKNCAGFTILDVKPNKVYRLRFIGGLTFRMLSINIPGHDMTLTEIDGEYVKPYPINHLELVPGQRSSVLIRTGNFTAGTTFPISTHFAWINPAATGYTPNGYGYIRYVPDDTNHHSFVRTRIRRNPTSLPPFRNTDVHGWVLRNLKPAFPPPPHILSSPPTRTIKLSMLQVRMPDNTTRFKNNGRVHQEWGTDTMSLLDQIRKDPDVGKLSPLDGFSVKHQTYPMLTGEIVDIVFQNMKIAAGICVAHPWHTHGYSHYLLAEGSGDYNHEEHQNIRTYENPLLKDVSMQYPVPEDGAVPCGWTKVRIFTVSLFLLLFFFSITDIF